MPPKRPRLSDPHAQVGSSSSSIGAQPGPSGQRLDPGPSAHQRPGDEAPYPLPPNPTATPQRRRRSPSKLSQATPEHPYHAAPRSAMNVRGAMGPPLPHYAGLHSAPRPDPRPYTPGPYANGEDSHARHLRPYPRELLGPEAGMADGYDAADESPLSICVFQCKRCLRLLGDTFSYLHVEEELGYLILTATTKDVEVKTGMHHITTQTPDIGSSYMALVCAGCHADLGKKYITTPRELDHIRGAFSLIVDHVTTYALGSFAKEQAGEAGSQPLPSMIPPQTAETSTAAPPSSSLNSGRDQKSRDAWRNLADRVVRLENNHRDVNILLKTLIEKTGVQFSEDDEDDQDEGDGEGDEEAG